MSDTVIIVEKLSKKYRLGVINHGRLAKDLQSWWARFRGKDDPNTRIDVAGISQRIDEEDNFWALKDVSFDVSSSDRVGIIGKNGAGKSTLLKILSRITEPTKGQIKVKGRVASLLEVGTGFHPELTGRENIFLNGAILGMNKPEVNKKLDEIIAFAEIERFIDTPVKRYSSGMYVRLAFAVAAHLEPDILVVDEVLSVGDTAFQKKCIGKMEDVSKKEGRTILYVSHNLFSLQNLCTKGILLEYGCIKAEGKITEVISTYMGYGQKNDGEIKWTSQNDAPGNNRARLKAVRIVSKNKITGKVDITDDFDVEIDFWNLENNSRRLVSLDINNALGIKILLSANTPSVCLKPDPWYNRQYKRGIYRSSCTIPGMFLNDGLHSISVFINAVGEANSILYIMDVLSFTVQDTGEMRKEYTGPWVAAVRPRLDWKTIQLE